MPTCLSMPTCFFKANFPSYPVVDGTYLTTPRLEVTGGGYAAHVPVMNGGNRDELAVLGLYLPTTDATEAILGLGAALGFNTTAATAPGIFPLPLGVDATKNIFNLSHPHRCCPALR